MTSHNTAACARPHGCDGYNERAPRLSFGILLTLFLIIPPPTPPACLGQVGWWADATRQGAPSEHIMTNTAGSSRLTSGACETGLHVVRLTRGQFETADSPSETVVC